MNLPTAWKLLTRLASALGLLLAILIGFELLRIFVFLYRLRPGYGWTFAIFIISGMVSVGIYLFTQWRQFPSRRRPPRRIDLDQASHPELKQYAQHMIAELKHQTLNAWIPDDTLAWLEEEIDTLEGLLNHHPLNEDLIRIISKSDEEILPALQEPLWQEVDAIVQSCTQRILCDAACGTERPIHHVRLLFTQIGMIDRIVGIGDPVPTIRNRIRIIIDVGKALLSPPVEQAEQSLIRKFQGGNQPSASQNDRIGTVAGTGLITAICGQIAFQRCVSAHRWDSEDADTMIRDCLPDCLARIQTLLRNDVQPLAKPLSPSETPKSKTSPDINGVFNAAVRETRSAQPRPSQSPRRPTKTSAPRSATARERMDREPKTSQAPRKRRKRRTKRRRGIARVLHTFGQRLKYTMGWGGS